MKALILRTIERLNARRYSLETQIYTNSKCVTEIDELLQQKRKKEITEIKEEVQMLELLVEGQNEN